MKNIYIFFLQSLIIYLPSSFSQAGQWTWIHGSNASFSMGVHGILGVPDSANTPAVMYEAAEWTDLSGNFWLYGGLDVANHEHNDLWRYNPATNQWTWMTGTNTVKDPGSYGIQGVPSRSNRPPARAWGAASWVDTSGNFWMFGGMNGTSDYNDLWKYNVHDTIWTWMKGSNGAGATGVYGTKGIANVANTPGSRWECVTAWTDDAGDLWLFGGMTFSGLFNDLWKYNIASNTWTWMTGSSGYGQTGVYGTLGAEAAANTPGARLAYSHWKDKSGNLWLFGGKNLGIGFSDLWRYNPTTGYWAWINGSKLGNQYGVYGTRCIASPGNFPGQRYENRAAWTDQNGNFWMFGGGLGSNFTEVWNDLWMYCVETNLWTWAGGDSIVNPVGSWGTKGIPDASNRPSGRSGSVAWTDRKGHLYLFGGTGQWLTPHNDLWVFTIDPSCGSCGAVIIPPVASFQTNDSTLCANDCIDFTDLSINASAWKWSFHGGLPSSSTDQNPKSICYTTSGTYDVSLIASNSGGSDSITFNNYINVKSAPPTPFIIQHDDTLFCITNPAYISYQWYDSTILIPGATDTFLVITHGGNYNVQVENEDSCKVAAGININLGVEMFSAYGNEITVAPNPASKELRIQNTDFGITGIVIYNVLGENIYTYKYKPINRKPVTVIDVSAFPAGIYFVQVVRESSKWNGKFVKE